MEIISCLYVLRKQPFQPWRPPHREASAKFLSKLLDCLSGSFR
jgi:hypothetical protein